MTVERFIGRVALFGAVVGLTILALFLVIGKRTGGASNFALGKDAETVFIGHSHIAYGINDSLLPASVNCARQGECYYYSYFKLRSLLAANPGIKNVIIDASNNQVTERMDDWIWGDRFLQENYPHYAMVMDPAEQLFLFSRNPSAFASSLSEALRGQVTFLASGSRDYLDHFGAKGYMTSDKVMKLAPEHPGMIAQATIATSEKNLASLRAMLDLCRDKGVRAFLLRLPLHGTSVDHRYDSTLQATMRSRYPETEILDMSFLAMPHTCFIDAEHTNTKGARAISEMLGGLMREGLLDRDNKQGMIDRAITAANDSISRTKPVN